MATCTAGVATVNNANTTAYAAGTFTPALSDLLVCLVATTGSIEPTAAGAVSDNRGGTYYKAAFSTRNSANSIYTFVRNQLVSSAVSHILTFTCGGDAATGAVILVYRVSGMTRAGSIAVKQIATQIGLAAGGTPTVVFSVACLTGNTVIGVVGTAQNPAALTPPSGWTESAAPLFDTGTTTPAAGCEGCHINSGFTSTTVTWGSVSSGISGSIAVELDTTLAPIGGRQAIKIRNQAVKRASIF